MPSKSEQQQALAILGHERLLAFSMLLDSRFEAPAHLKLLAKKLEAIEKGDIKRLMVFMPPRHGKSMLCSQMFPAWYIGRHPERQIITATYGHSLASKFGRDVRNLVNEPLYQKIFPGTQLAEDSQAKDRFNTNHNGVYLATGIGGAATGYGAHLLLIDDPVKDRQDALSETISENTWNWYTSVAHTRLMPGGAIIVILTRWSDNDLAGRILAHEPEKWDVVSLSAIEDGKALWPEKYTIDDLLAIKSSIGPIEFSCLYQQQPINQENAEFKKYWFKYFSDDECPGNLKIYTTVDPAISKKSSADESAIVTVGVSPANDKYILEVTHARMNPSELINAIFQHIDKYDPSILGIETVAYQEALSHFMKLEMRKRNKFVKIQEIRSRQDKEQKIRGLIPHYSNGTIHHRAGLYCAELEEQLLRFPVGSHDDQIDALAMQLELWSAPLHNLNILNKPVIKSRAQLMKEEQLFSR